MNPRDPGLAHQHPSRQVMPAGQKTSSATRPQRPNCCKCNSPSGNKPTSSAARWRQPQASSTLGQGSKGEEQHEAEAFFGISNHLRRPPCAHRMCAQVRATAARAGRRTWSQHKGFPLAPGALQQISGFQPPTSMRRGGRAQDAPRAPCLECASIRSVDEHTTCLSGAAGLARPPKRDPAWHDRRGGGQMGPRSWDINQPRGQARAAPVLPPPPPAEDRPQPRSPNPESDQPPPPSVNAASEEHSRNDGGSDPLGHRGAAPRHGGHPAPTLL